MRSSVGTNELSYYSSMMGYREGRERGRAARHTIHGIKVPDFSRALEVPWILASIRARVRNLGLDFSVVVDCTDGMVRDLDQEVHSAETVR
jgi:hypothetical protein